MLRKTKIICTLGPAVESEEMMRKLIRAGMDAARFNFSHGDHEEHLGRLNKLKAVRDSMSRPVATIMDTKGPEIRIKSFDVKSISLEAGDTFTLTTEDVVGNGERVAVTYPKLHEEVKPGMEILIDDGLVALRVEEIQGAEIRCTVENGGTLSANKSINIPGVHIHLPALTEKDISDIQFAVENDFSFQMLGAIPTLRFRADPVLRQRIASASNHTFPCWIKHPHNTMFNRNDTLSTHVDKVQYIVFFIGSQTETL